MLHSLKSSPETVSSGLDWIYALIFEYSKNCVFITRWYYVSHSCFILFCLFLCWGFVAYEAYCCSYVQLHSRMETLHCIESWRHQVQRLTLWNIVLESHLCSPGTKWSCLVRDNLLYDKGGAKLQSRLREESMSDLMVLGHMCSQLLMVIYYVFASVCLDETLKKKILLV